MTTKHKVFFRFYEELNDFLPSVKQKHTFEYDFIDKTSIKDMIEKQGVPHTEIDLILVNGKSVNFSYIVKDKDRISVYPQIETLNISGITKLRPKPLRSNKFALDVHLGKLAQKLRMLGFDCFYSNNVDDPDLVKKALEERRIILTRDLGILKRKNVTHAYYIRNTNPNEQLKEVVGYFDLSDTLHPFSRCILCNQELKPVKKEKIQEQLPPEIKKNFTVFSYCSNCNKIYWKGSHFERMKQHISCLCH